MANKPTDEEKRKTLFWDGIAAVLFLIGIFMYRYGVEVNWWQPLFPL